MILQYRLDLSGDSLWQVLTPNAAMQRLPFSVTESGHFYAGPDFYTQRDSKRQYYLVYTVAGSGAVEFRGQERVLEPGDAALLYCDGYHSYRTGEAGAWDHYWVHFEGESAPVYDELVNGGSFTPVSVRSRLEFEQTFDELLAIHGVPDAAGSVTLSLCVAKLLSMLSLERQAQARHDRHAADVDNAIAYIRSHYAQPVTLDDLTRHVHLSKYYFVKLFRQYTATTPYEYLMSYRINKAKQLLRTTELAVSQISEQVGFPSHNNFNKQFKAAVGCTPLAFRKSAW